VAAILLRTWRHQPDVVRVVVREIARSPEIQERIGELRKPIDSIRRIIEHGQESGELRAELNPRLAAVMFYGGIDEILTAWVLAQMPDGDDAITEAEQSFAEYVTGCFVAR
jgi:hypothetical protein